jgi:hypothetical protein
MVQKFTAPPAYQPKTPLLQSENKESKVLWNQSNLKN